MGRLKGILLYSFGAFLLVFGNKNALSALFEDKGKTNQPEEEKVSQPSMFGTIELNKNGTDSISSSTTVTSIESDDVEAATGSE